MKVGSRVTFRVPSPTATRFLSGVKFGTRVRPSQSAAWLPNGMPQENRVLLDERGRWEGGISAKSRLRNAFDLPNQPVFPTACLKRIEYCLVSVAAGRVGFQRNLVCQILSAVPNDETKQIELARACYRPTPTHKHQRLQISPRRKLCRESVMNGSSKPKNRLKKASSIHRKFVE